METEGTCCQQAFMKRIMKGNFLGRIKIILHGNIKYKMEEGARWRNSIEVFCVSRVHVIQPDQH